MRTEFCALVRQQEEVPTVGQNNRHEMQGIKSVFQTTRRFRAHTTRPYMNVLKTIKRIKMKHLTKLLASVLSALGLNQAAGTSDISDFRETLQLAEQGVAKAQYNLGVMYANGRGVRQNDAEALRWYRKAAEQEDADAQFNLGGMYAYGRGVRQDDTEAVKWFRQAAAQGLTQAQYNLGIMYYSGRGVHQDRTLAQEWFGKACQNGYQKGCDNYQHLKAGY